MILRPATAADAERIVEILTPVVRETTITFTTHLKTPDEVAAEIAARGSAYQVAERDGRVLGFATYFPFRGGDGYRHVKEHTISLAPEARGAGAGRALMERLFEVGRAEQVHCMMAAVSGENAAGIAFHAALGFEPRWTIPELGRKFDRWIDLVLMQKML